MISLKKAFVIIAIIMGWFALIAQFFLAIDNRSASGVELVIRYFSYFTIEANGLAAIGFTVLLVARQSVVGKWFSKQSVMTAITLYMTVVGLTYNFVLRSLWKPEGLQRVVDELLHSFLPVWYIVYWLLYTAAKRRMFWKSLPSWMLYPLIYCIYTLVRGVLAGWYPYPFLDAGIVGYPRVVINIVAMVAVFVGLAALFVVLSKRIYRRGGH